MKLFCEVNIKYLPCIKIIGTLICWLGEDIVLFIFHQGIQFYEAPNFIRKTVFTYLIQYHTSIRLSISSA